MRCFLSLTLALGLALPLTFAGCGKKGALQPPPTADAPVEEPRRLF